MLFRSNCCSLVSQRSWFLKWQCQSHASVEASTSSDDGVKTAWTLTTGVCLIKWVILLMLRQTNVLRISVSMVDCLVYTQNLERLATVIQCLALQGSQESSYKIQAASLPGLTLVFLFRTSISHYISKSLE